MPPKKAKTTTTTTQPRRSARLNSREPSVEEPLAEKPAVEEEEEETVSKKAKAPKRQWDVNTTVAALDRGEANVVYKLTSAQRSEVITALSADKANLSADNADLQRQVAQLQTVLAGQKTAPATSKPGQGLRRAMLMAKIDAEMLEKSLPATYPSPRHQPARPTAPIPTGSSEEMAPASPATPPPAAPQQEQPPSGWRKMLSSVGSYMSIGTPFGRKRPAEDDDNDDDAAPAQKRARTSLSGEMHAPTEEPEHTSPSPRVEEHAGAEPAQQSPELQGREMGGVPQSTPRPTHPSESPRDYAGPSTMNPKLPTSLSTITEYTEPSFLSSFSESTPSRPPRSQPPRSLPPTTPTIRRAALVRAARASQSINRSTADYSWAPKVATPKPKEPNADARLAKLERMRALQKELKELEEDKDIQEMQSHRRKRVKIDNLPSIPHNRPGDSAGTFRVPEPDSDDEIEVMEGVEEASNLFNSEMEDGAVEEESEVAEYTFPEIGAMPTGYEVTEDFKQQACSLFEEGLLAFVSA